MTFLSRRKRQITHRASPAKWATTIISAILVWLGAWSGVHGQAVISGSKSPFITPKFVPIGKRPALDWVPTTYVMPASFQPPQAKNGVQPRLGGTDEAPDLYVRTELPGPQRLFTRESEAQFYDRVRQEAKRQIGANPPVFPEETPISKEVYTHPSYPRNDPLLKARFPEMVEVVEPGYVCHRRLLFEQPNFERYGWDFGATQPILHLSTFYYDMALLPYHFWSDLRSRGECNTGKCLPGDPAPFTVPIERFSVTGVIGKAGVLIGGAYLFPR